MKEINETKIKQAFQNIKQDMFYLQQEIDYLRQDIGELRFELNQQISQIAHNFNNIISNLTQKKHQKTLVFTQNTQIQQKQNSTKIPKISTISTHPSTYLLPPEAPKPQNMPISTGNQGASTDRQTDRHTDKNAFFTQEIKGLEELETKPEQNNQEFNQEPSQKIHPESLNHSIENASKILDSLDAIKKEIRLKFKMLTEQELLVFSTIYQLDQEQIECNYKTLAQKLNLTESSIRDYVGRLIKKGIPVDKNKIKNKNITLSISQNLKKIASLPTILQLRDL